MGRQRLVSLAALYLCLSATAAEPQEEPPLLPDLAGRWYSEFGYLEIAQEGREIEGTYSCCDGTIEGVVKGPQIEFEWRDPIYGEGWGVFHWHEDEPDRLVGGWGRSDDMGYAGRWHAVRVPEWSFEGEPSAWLVESEHPTFGPLRATARLYRTGDALEGYVEGVYPTEARGQPFRMEVLYRLSGRWEGERLVLSWRDVAREDATGSMELHPLGDGGSGILVGSWEGHLSPEEQAVRFVPAVPDGAAVNEDPREPRNDDEAGPGDRPRHPPRGAPGPSRRRAGHLSLRLGWSHSTIGDCAFSRSPRSPAGSGTRPRARDREACRPRGAR